MGLFDKNKENKAYKEIDEWFSKLSKLKENGEILQAVERFDFGKVWTEQAVFDYAIEKCKTIDPQVLPLLIEALYRSEDKLKFIFGCTLLDICCESLPFITNLESINISDEHFSIFFKALTGVWERCWNGLGDCMMLILLNFADKKELFDDEKITKIIDITTPEITAILKWIDKEKPVTTEIPASLELLVDVIGYFNNPELLDLVEQTVSLGKTPAQMFAVATLLKNNRQVADTTLEMIAEDLALAYRLLKLLERIDRTDCFPKKYANQEYIAKSCLCDWLVYPTELGSIPKEIECIQTLEYNYGNDKNPDVKIFYVYKFRSNGEKFNDKGWMVGLSGGYDSGAPLTTNSTGHTFSMFETLEGDGIEQGAKIYKLISDQWKQWAIEQGFKN